MRNLSIIMHRGEEKIVGEHRTIRVILEIYDALVEATQTGKGAPNTPRSTPARPSMLSPTAPTDNRMKYEP